MLNYSGFRPATHARSLKRRETCEDARRPDVVLRGHHQDARNKATHFVGVPLIAFSLMIPLGWLRADVGGFALSAALVVTAVLLLYYLVLDVPLGLAMVAVFGVMLWAAEPLSQAAFAASLGWFLVLFIGGWALQLWGHVYEGRKPALVDNLFRSLSRPSSSPLRYSSRSATNRRCTKRCSGAHCRCARRREQAFRPAT